MIHPDIIHEVFQIEPTSDTTTSQLHGFITSFWVLKCDAVYAITSTFALKCIFKQAASQLSSVHSNIFRTLMLWMPVLLVSLPTPASARTSLHQHLNFQGLVQDQGEKTASPDTIPAQVAGLHSFVLTDLFCHGPYSFKELICIPGPLTSPVTCNSSRLMFHVVCSGL